MTPIANGESGASARAKINAVLPQAIPFATAVPLDGRKVMAAQAVSAGLAFTPAAGAQLGGECYVELTADGAHAPSFAGFVEDGGSAGWNNTSGVVNRLLFSCWGASPRFAVWQDANAVPFVMAAATIAAGTPGQIVVGFDRDMNRATVPAAAAFIVANSGGTDAVTAAAWIDARTLRLTKSRATLAGDTVQLSYSPPGSSPLADLNGNLAGASTIAVANTVGAGSGSAPGYVRFTTLTGGMAESGPAGGAYSYASPGATGYDTAAGPFGTAAAKLAANTDGWIAIHIGAVPDDGPFVGLATGTPTNFATATYGLYASSHGGATSYSLWLNGGPATPDTVQALTANDWMRVRRAGTTIFWEVSGDFDPAAGTGTWRVAKTLAGGSAATLTPLIGNGSASAVIGTPVGQGLA